MISNSVVAISIESKCSGITMNRFSKMGVGAFLGGIMLFATAGCSTLNYAFDGKNYNLLGENDASGPNYISITDWRVLESGRDRIYVYFRDGSSGTSILL